MIEFMITLLVPVVIAIWLGIRIVPQGEEWVVERLGNARAIGIEEIEGRMTRQEQRAKGWEPFPARRSHKG